MQPASYWYLRGFNLQEMEQYVSWFNIMTYDIRKLISKIMTFADVSIFFQTAYGTRLLM